MFGKLLPYSITFLAIMIVGISQSLLCTEQTKSCPQTLDQWNRRAANFNCTTGNYICILTYNKSLAEACMLPSFIQNGDAGCPFIGSCDAIHGPILIHPGKYFPCQEIHNCPPKNHSGYSVFDIYKYPACLIETRKINEYNNTDIILENIGRLSWQNIFGIVTASIVITALALTIIAFLVIRRRNGRARTPSSFITIEAGREINTAMAPLIEEHPDHHNCSSDYPDGVKRAIKDMEDAISFQEKLGRYVEIAQINAAVNTLFSEGCVAFIGLPGSGKSVNSIHVADLCQKKGWTVMKLMDLKDRSDFDRVSVVFFEDIFNGVSRDRSIFHEKKHILECIAEKISAKSIHVIFTMRTAIYHQMRNDLQEIGLLHDSQIIDLDAIDRSSRENILRHNFDVNNIHEAEKESEENWQQRTLSRNTIGKILDIRCFHIGFPMIVHEFCSKSEFFSLKMKFFYHPTKTIIERIARMKIEKETVELFCSMVYVFLCGGHTDPSEYDMELMWEIEDILGINTEMTKESFFQSVDSSIRLGFLAFSGDTVRFTHDVIMEATCISYTRHSDKSFKQVLSKMYLHSNFILELFVPYDYKPQKEEQVIFIPEDCFSKFLECLRSFAKDGFLTVFSNPIWNDVNFLKLVKSDEYLLSDTVGSDDILSIAIGCEHDKFVRLILENMENKKYDLKHLRPGSFLDALKLFEKKRNSESKLWLLEVVSTRLDALKTDEVENVFRYAFIEDDSLIISHLKRILLDSEETLKLSILKDASKYSSSTRMIKKMVEHLQQTFHENVTAILESACENRGHLALKCLMKEDEKSRNFPRRNLQDLFEKACSLGNVDAVKYLVKIYRQMLTVKLTIDPAENFNELARLLLENASNQDCLDDTYLFLCRSSKTDGEIMKIAVPRVCTKARLYEGFSMACKCANKKIVEWCLEHFEQKLCLPKMNECICYCFAHDHRDVFEWLLSTYKHRAGSINIGLLKRKLNEVMTEDKRFTGTQIEKKVRELDDIVTSLVERFKS